MAKKYVREFSKLGANIIKFQTRNNKFLFSKKLITNNTIVKMRLVKPMVSIEKNWNSVILN